MPHPRIFANSTVAVACLALLSPQYSSAQARCDWGRVRALSPGQTITVEIAPGQRVSGSLLTSSATDVTVSSGGVSEKIARDQIVEVSARKTTTWKTGVGLVIGGLGLMVAGTIGRPAEAGPGPAWIAGVPMAAIGALIAHSEESRQGLIYRRP